MKTLLVTLALVLASNSHALSLNFKTALKDDATAPRLTVAQFNKLYASSVAVCIHDGARIIGMNQAAVNVGGKRTCRSKTAQEMLASKKIEYIKLSVKQMPLELLSVN